MRLRIVFLVTLTSGLTLALIIRTAPAEQFGVGGGSSAPVEDASVGMFIPVPDLVGPVIDHSAAMTDAAGEWTLAGQLGGNVTDVAWLDDYALLGFGPRVVVVDVTAPDNPRWVATSLPLPDVVWGIAVAGDRAYVAAGDAGLFVLDAADPLDLQVLGSLALPARALDVQVAGDYAYIVVTDVGLRVVDVRDPARLLEVGALERSEGRREAWSRLAVSGGMAVALEQLGPVTILDVRNPRQPVRISQVSVPGGAMDVAIVGERAIVANDGPGFTMFNLADPAQLTEHELAGVQRLWCVTVDGTTAYLADMFGALHMLDVSDPDNPRALGQVGQFDPFHEVVVTALAARSGIVLAPSLRLPNSGFPGGWPGQSWYGGGLRIVDATQPAQPSVVATLRMPVGVVRDIDPAGDGRSVWVIDSSREYEWHEDTPDFADNAALLIDATDPARPRVRASLRLPGDAEAVALAVMGSTVYVLGMSPEAPSDVYVFDATNLDAPEYKRAVGIAGTSLTSDFERYGVDLLVAGEHLLVSELDRMYWLGLSNPTTPQIIGTYDWWDGGRASNAGLIASEPFIYIAAVGGLNILDMRDPATLRLAARFQMNDITGIAASGLTVLAVSADNNMRVIDMSRWANLRELGRVAVPASSYTAVAATADRAFVIDGRGDVTVWDITLPATPGALYSIATAAPATWEDDFPRTPVIAAASGRVYASANGLGLLIYSHEPVGVPPEPDRPHRTYFPAVYRAHLRPPTLRRRKLELVGQLASNGKPFQVSELAADERHAYLAMGEGCDGSLGIVDLARLASPVFASTIDLPFMPVAVRVVDHRVYAAGVGCEPAGSGAFAIIDVARPDQPRMVGQLSLPHAVFDLAVVGRWVYVIEVLTDNPFPIQDLPKNPGPPHVRIIDAADPAAPREIGRIALDRSSRATGIAAVNGSILLSDYDLGLRIFNVADPAAPREVASVPIAGAFDVAVENDRAYLVTATDSESNAPQGLWIIDIADPARPREIGALVGVYFLSPEENLAGLRVAVEDGLAYTNSDSGLRAFDVHDPAWPFVLDTDASGSIGVAVAGRRVFTVGGGGLSIFELVDR